MTVCPSPDAFIVSTVVRFAVPRSLRQTGELAHMISDVYNVLAHMIACLFEP